MESNLVPAMSMSSMPPLKRAPVAATPTTALRSELTALRQKEGRLDALLQSHSEEWFQLTPVKLLCFLKLKL